MTPAAPRSASSAALTYALLTTALLGATACTSDSSDAGLTPVDAEAPDAGGGAPDAEPDAGIAEDAAEAPDSGDEPDGGLQAGVAPARRGDMAFAIDPATDRVYMFFGDRAEPANCGPAASDFMEDGWVFDPASNRWAELEIQGAARPQRRARSSGVWDEARGRFILFGGRYRAGASGSYTFLDDVWAFDPATAEWTELSAQGSPGGPSGRMNTTMVADPANDRVLIHAGGTTNFTAFTVDSETWAFNLADNTWQQLGMGPTQPTARIFHVAALDRTRQRLFVWAGAGEDAFTATSFFRDLWYLDLATDTWTEVPADASFPAGRIKATMELDAARDRLVMFAGHDDGQLGNDNDVWTFDLANLRWTREIQGDTFNRLFPGSPFCDFPADFANVDLASPERRESHLFLIRGDRAFMYGGRTDCGLTNDTWVLDLTTMTWTQVTMSFNGMTCFRSGRTDCEDPNARKCG